jgi:hypothetical protein
MFVRALEFRARAAGIASMTASGPAPVGLLVRRELESEFQTSDNLALPSIRKRLLGSRFALMLELARRTRLTDSTG